MNWLHTLIFLAAYLAIALVVTTNPWILDLRERTTAATERWARARLGLDDTPDR